MAWSPGFLWLLAQCSFHCVRGNPGTLGGIRWTRCALNEVLGSKSELESFWQDYVLHWSSLHIDSGASLELARFFMKWTEILTQTKEVLRRLCWF